MQVQHTNSKGVTYFLFKRQNFHYVTKQWLGEFHFFAKRNVARDGEEAVTQLPEGRSIKETNRGLPYLSAVSA